MGMRYQQTLVTQLLQGVLDMEESVTYQAIIRKGAVQGAIEEARKMLLRLGETHFQSEPPANLRKRVEKIEDLHQLEQLILSIEPLQSWDELLAALPKTKRRSASQH